MDCICLISAPRTGTNHLCGVLRNFADMATYGGVFDPDVIQGTDPETWPLIKKRIGIEFMSGSDRRLVTYAREHPGNWLDALVEAAASRGKRLLCIRLFRHDLDIDVAEREVMQRPGVRPIMVVRKQIDSFISWRKAVETGRSSGLDTTGMRLKLDAGKFEEWLVGQERWYGYWRQYFTQRGIPCPIVRYELDIDQPADRILRRFTAAAAQVGITLKAPATITHAGLERQDKAKSMVEKVTNWAEFSREIFGRGLERRAFGYPLQGWA